MNVKLMAKLGVFIVIAALMAAMELGTLTGPHVGTTHTYHAIFGGADGVSGLRANQQVRVAGVPVGKVTGVKLRDAEHAEVTFTVNGNQTLTTNTWAVVRYANLLGQRYLALTQSGTTAGSPLRHGATIPADHTAPALSLTALFNGFRPLFQALTPSQVNDISQAIIDVLQGQAGTIDDLVTQTAELTANLADRNDTFTTIIDSLSTLLTTVAKHDNQLAGIVTALHSLTQTLHTDGPAIVDSLTSVDHLIGSVGGLLQQLENHNLPGDIADLNSVTGVVAQHSDKLTALIDGFVTAFTDFARISQNGNWVNVYACNVTILTYGAVSVTGGDIVQSLLDGVNLGQLTAILSKYGLTVASLAALAIPTPLKLPNGVVGSSSSHTKVCS